MQLPCVRGTLDRQGAEARYLANRARSRELFDLLAPEVYLSRPIPLRNPVVFYEGHLPAFAANTLLGKGLGLPGLHERYDRIFARGIDPEDEASSAPRGGVTAWPARDEVLRYGEAVDAAVLRAIREEDLERDDHPVLRRAQGLYALLEHEEMHHETMLYMWHRVPHEAKRRPPGYEPVRGGAPPPRATVRIPAGRATLGADPEEIPFGWDNEFPRQEVEVPVFDIDVHDVTNSDFMDFVEAGGYRDPRWWTPEGWAWIPASGAEAPPFWRQANGGWLWRGMFQDLPLPAAWPAWCTHAEASAYARWRGRRLMTEAEFHRAAYGTPSGEERPQPWGEGEPDPERHGNFDLRRWDPVPVGHSPGGASAWGVHDLVGNGWEWTSTVFAGFPGFQPMASYPEYSADFFDGLHRVMKGASPATGRHLVRRSFRNWFRTEYPYVQAAFRTVGDLS